MTHPDDDAPQPQEPPRSIWEPLDGSEPRPVPPRAPEGFGGGGAGGLGGAGGGPAAFEKPAAQPLAFPGVAPQVRGGTPPRVTADGRAVHVLAGWGPRFGAFLIDSILIGVVVLCVTLPLGLALGLTIEETLQFFSTATLPDSAADDNALYAVYAVQVLLPSLVQAGFLVRWNGQTPGKRLLNLRVVRADGAPIDLAVAARREVLGKTILMAVLAAVTLGLGVLLNYLWPIWDSQNRAGHDALAGTRVVAEPRER